jgi:glyoxylase-like metal-dependent hydrolase (beta-lactamase superfamily II)
MADADAVEQVTTVRVDRRVIDGDLVAVGDLKLGVIGLRGHTPGSIALALSAADGVLLFTGDSLFPGGLGKTDGDRERFDRLFGDVTRRIFDRFDDDARVLPGHGAPTTLGAERPHLDEWRGRGW